MFNFSAQNSEERAGRHLNVASPSLRLISKTDNLVRPGNHIKIEISNATSLSVMEGISLG